MKKMLFLLWNSLYNMFRDKLLMLRKILMKLLNKNFININNFFVVISMLFIKKLNEKLYFCVNYHALNCFTQKNRYSLFLINETLKWIEKIIWFIKLNVITVFHKIKIEKRQKWLIIFHTRYKLFEWLMTFFDLINALNMFQKYINSALQNFLNKFVSIYLNNILIFIIDNLKDYKKN